MDAIKGFFEELGSRIRNPLLFSFLISWLIWNWEIIVGITILTDKQIYNIGYYNKLDFIKNHLMVRCTFIAPFLISLSYVYLFPIIKNLIKIHNSKIDSEGDKKAIEAARNGYIKTNIYIKLREDYIEREKKLNEIIELEQENTIELSKIKEAVKNKDMRIIELERNISSTLYSGDWDLAFGDSNLDISYDMYAFFNVQTKSIRVLFYTNNKVEIDVVKNNTALIKLSLFDPKEQFFLIAFSFENESQIETYYQFMLKPLYNIDHKLVELNGTLTHRNKTAMVRLKIRNSNIKQ